jgi:hypothetical protein
MGLISNVSITDADPDSAVGRTNVLLDASSNGSVPRLDVSNRTIQESKAKHAMESSDGDSDSLDKCEQEEQTSRLYSKTPSKQRLIQKKESKNLIMTTEQDKDVPVVSAAAALAFGHHRGSSSGSNNSTGGTSIGTSSPKRRAGQVSASLRWSMKGHAHAGTHWSIIRSNQSSPSC